MQLHYHVAFLKDFPCHNASEDRRPEVNEQMAFTYCPSFRLVSPPLISACLEMQMQISTSFTLIKSISANIQRSC